MAKESIVSRTITITKCKILCVDKDKKETVIKDFEIPRVYKNSEALIKEVSKMVEEDNIKVVDVIETEIEVSKYFMTEKEFIKIATKKE